MCATLSVKKKHVIVDKTRVLLIKPIISTLKVS